MKCNLDTMNTYTTEYITNIQSEMNLEFGEYWEISENDLLKLCQKLENSVKTVV